MALPVAPLSPAIIPFRDDQDPDDMPHETVARAIWSTATQIKRAEKGTVHRRGDRWLYWRPENFEQTATDARAALGGTEATIVLEGHTTTGARIFAVWAGENEPTTDPEYG
jgi:hypothetical protein